MTPRPHSLDEYRRKRTADATPEPFGGEKSGSDLSESGLFVVQKHAARRTHWDLRLELDGVLLSWAVPRGPSLDPDEKRLAVQTEDHPFEYGDFEGVIPEGNYGAGAMIVWDRGLWVPLEDPRVGMDKGKLLFELRGYKLHGVWTLFRTKRPAIHQGKSKDDDRQWLLMKKPDGAARREGEYELVETSVLSGLTVEELAEGAASRSQLEAEVAELGSPIASATAPLDPLSLELMLAQPGEEPFSREGWLFELKYDGYRLLASVDHGDVFLRYRNGADATHLFPELTRALGAQPVRSMLLDGEVVVLQPDGRPAFQRLQKRAMLRRALDIDQAALQHPATYFVFDLLAFAGRDLRSLPLIERKRLLNRVLPSAGPVRYCDHVERRGEDFFRQVEAMGLEGMLAKKADSPYVGGRSDEWLKYRVERSGDFVIVGFTRPKGLRSGFGALHLAAWKLPETRSDEVTESVSSEAEPHLTYAGRVGTGFDDQLLEELHSLLEERQREEPAFVGEVPSTSRYGKAAQHVWVEPELVCEVRYKEWTEIGQLRHPVFERLRDDKTVEDCRREAIDLWSSSTPASHDPPPPAVAGIERPRLQFTNLDKIFWPEDGFTKGDMIEYYRQVAPVMLRYLEDRPLVLTRYPDGIRGKSFFQKNAPDFAPDWIRTETIHSEGSQRDIDYFVGSDTDTLLYLANLGAIVLHVWSSRMASLDRPDWCILDLDPKEASFEDVIIVAKRIRELCSEIELPTFVKTSGSSGLHVLIPLGRACSYEQSRTLGQLIATLVSQELSEIATVVRNPAKREGKVYIDYVQNGHGRLLVAPFSLRPLDKAPASTPLFWSEVEPGLTIEQHNLSTVPMRLADQEHDPLAGVLEEKPDLVAALARLAELL